MESSRELVKVSNRWVVVGQFSVLSAVVSWDKRSLCVYGLVEVKKKRSLRFSSHLPRLKLSVFLRDSSNYFNLSLSFNGCYEIVIVAINIRFVFVCVATFDMTRNVTTRAEFLEPSVINCAFNFRTTNILIASVTLWASSNSFSITSCIRWGCTLICAALKLHTKWSNVQHASAPTTTILPSTVWTTSLQTGKYRSVDSPTINKEKQKNKTITLSISFLYFYIQTPPQKGEIPVLNGNGFDFYSRYYINFRSNNLMKFMNPLNPHQVLVK